MNILDYQARIEAVARNHDLSFVRVFGSSLTRPDAARDIDLAVPENAKIDSKTLLDLIQKLEQIFKKKVDLIFLSSKLPPRLILEIARTSTPIYESVTGRDEYAALIDKLHAVATDELLSYNDDLKSIKITETQKRLKNA